MTLREQRRQMAERLWGGFYRCPTTGRVLEQLPGDDKVLCPCSPTGTHRVAELERVSVEEYLDDRERRKR